MKDKKDLSPHLSASRFTGTELYACEWTFIKECTLAVSDLFWKKSDGRLYRLAQKGDYLDHEKLKKFYDKNQTLFSAITKLEDFEEYLDEMLAKFSEAEFEKQRLVARQELISFLYQFYYLQDSHAELFDMVHVFDRRFNLLRKDHLGFLLSYPDHHRRASLIGALNVIGGILLGYNSVSYLQDLYSIAFFYQASTYPQMSLNVSQAYDLERKSHQAFEQYVLGLSEAEQGLIFSHPQTDYMWAKDQFAHVLHHESSYQLIQRTHERVNGSGYPHQLCQEEISDIEMWILFVSRCFSVAGFQYRSEDGAGFLPKLLAGRFGGEELEDILGRRVKLLVEAVLSPYHLDKEVA